MFVIVKYMKNDKGIEIPVLIVDAHSEILEFDTEKEAEEIKEMFQANTDSGHRYVVKKVGTLR